MQAVLFDMDGTIVDTEPYWVAAEYELVESHGGTWSQERLRRTVAEICQPAEQVRPCGARVQLGDEVPGLATHGVDEPADVDGLSIGEDTVDLRYTPGGSGVRVPGRQLPAP